MAKSPSRASAVRGARVTVRRRRLGVAGSALSVPRPQYSFGTHASSTEGGLYGY